MIEPIPAPEGFPFHTSLSNTVGSLIGLLNGNNSAESHVVYDCNNSHLIERVPFIFVDLFVAVNLDCFILSCEVVVIFILIH